MCAQPSSVLQVAMSPAHISSSTLVQAVVPLLEFNLYSDSIPPLLVMTMPSSSRSMTLTGTSPASKFIVRAPDRVDSSTSTVASTWLLLQSRSANPEPLRVILTSRGPD